MDPTQNQFTTSNTTILPFGSYMFIPGIFDSDQDRDSYLSSLDSDTRNYVLKHTEEFQSRQDILDCVKELHGIS